MDAQRKKQLKLAYNERKPVMGIMQVRCLETGERFFIGSTDMKATENGLVARFDGGQHPNRHLQSLWNEYGRESFAFEPVEELEYDDVHEDHTEALQALLELCLEEAPEATRVWR